MLSSLIMLAALAAQAPAGGETPAVSPVEAAFGNTIVSTYPDRRTGLLWLHRDGTYDAKGRRRTSSSGKWEMDGPQVCLRQSRPIPVPFRYCTLIPENAIGARWEAEAVTGETVQVTVTPGIVD